MLVIELGSELSWRWRNGCWFCTGPTADVPGSNPHPWFKCLDRSSFYVNKISNCSPVFANGYLEYFHVGYCKWHFIVYYTSCKGSICSLSWPVTLPSSCINNSSSIVCSISSRDVIWSNKLDTATTSSGVGTVVCNHVKR